MLHSTILLGLLLPQGPNIVKTADASAQPLGQARVLKVLPVRELVARARPVVPPPLETFLHHRRNPDLLRVNEEGMALLGRDSVLELMTDLAPRNLSEVDAQMHGSSVVLTGPPDKVTVLEQTVRRMTAAFVREIQLQAELYHIPAGGEYPAIADAARYAELTAGLAKLWSGRAIGRSSTPLELSSVTRNAYVHDHDVEVASKASISDPKIDRTFEGVRVCVEPHALTASTDAVLYVQYAFGQRREELSARSTGVDDQGSIDVPHLEINSGTASARLANGSAMLIAMHGHRRGGGSMLLAIRATQAERPAGDTVVAFPVSALLSNALQADVWIRNSDDDESDDPDVFNLRDEVGESVGGVGSVDQLMGLLSTSLGTDGDDVRYAGGHVVVINGDQQQNVESFLRNLQKLWLTTAEVRAGTALVAGGGADGAGQLHSVSFPALLGRRHIAIRGHETTSIRDFNVEIAEKSTAADPEVERVFSGVALFLHAYARQQGIGAECECQLYDSPKLTRRPADNPKTGDLYLPRIGRTRLSHNGAVAADRALNLGDGPRLDLDGRIVGTRQSLRIRLN